MSEIQVNTSDLKNGSQNLKSASDEIRSAQSHVSNAPLSVGNAYDGQLKQALEGIIGGASQTGTRLQNRTLDLGDELLSRATGFEVANVASRNIANNILKNIFNYIEKFPLLKKLFSFNKSDISKASFLWGIGGFGAIPIFITLLPSLRPFFNQNPGLTPTNPNQSLTNSMDDLNLFKPQSPFDEHRITASFPQYADGHLHTGIDIQPKGYDKTRDWDKDFTIHPIGPGKVFQVGTEYKKNDKHEFVLDKDGNKIIDGYGNYVVIEHTLSDGTTIYSRYAHMKTPSTLKKGDIVGADTQMGNMGTSGNSSGQHVHLEVYKKGSYSGFGFKNPDDKFDPKDPNSLNFLDKMKEQFYDPAPFINGTTDVRFAKPTKG